MTELSPMMRHYQEMKERYNDCIILYRLGDFYEMFFEDAQLCSRVLGLTLTARGCGGDKKAPMCGIPAKAVENYLQKLIDANLKVAICEQLTDAKEGAVERDVIRIITPGTLIDSQLLDGSTNNFLSVVFVKDSKMGVSYVDISTGELYMTEFDSNIDTELNNLFSRITPKEVIANDKVKSIEDKLPVVTTQLVPNFSYILQDKFELNECEQLLLNQLKVKDLKSFDCVNKKLGIVATGVLLRYIQDTQKRDLSHINKITYVDNNQNMQIDSFSRRNLELIENQRDRGKKGSLLWVLDKTKTSMGKRTIRNFINNPLVNETEINYRLNGVEELVKNIVYRESLKELLNSVYDIERLSGKISYNNINPKDCVALCDSLKCVPKIKEVLSKFSSKILIDLSQQLSNLDNVAEMLDCAIDRECTSNTKDGNFIKEGFNEELDRLSNIKKNSAESLAQLESTEKELTGIKNLKIGYNRVFGYYIEVTKSALSQVPYRYIRKQTLTGAERFITDELKELEDQIIHAAERKMELELELFKLIRTKLLEHIDEFQCTARALGVIDTLTSFATVAVEKNYVKPIVSKGNKKLEIIGGRHPIVECVLKNDFVANDTLLNDTDSRTMLITGPNMAGKSTYMRQVALITLMTQIGSFVPAKSAKISIVDRIFTRIGASDDLLFGQSTFMVEMLEVSNILKSATNRSLILLDEIGRGTSTFDGLSIAWAVMEYIANNYNCKTLFSTHFHELTELEGRLDGVKNYKVSVKEYNDSIIFLRKIVRGSANQSFGIEVASLAELPIDVINRAKIILHSLEKHDLNRDIVSNSIDIDSTLEQKEMENRKVTSQIIGILKDLDINTLTPLNAFDVLIQLKNYIKD